MRVVLDTNVLVSALAFPGSKPDQVLALVRRNALQLFVSPFILSELDRVLRVKFKFSARQAAERVAFIRSIATVVAPSESVAVVTAKQDDNRILECALAARADFLVTGDRAHLLPLGAFRGTRIVTPGEILELVEGTAQGRD